MMNDYKPAHVFQEDLFTELVSKTLLMIISSSERKIAPLIGGS